LTDDKTMLKKGKILHGLGVYFVRH